MANKAHIYLNGIIGEQQYDFFSFEQLPSFDSKTVQDLLDQNKDANIIIAHITSNGGSVDEAFAIYDKLTNSKKKIITVAEGTVASAATVVYLAGEEREITKYAELMIHNPFLNHAEGDADELQKAADNVQRVEDKLAKLYADVTGTPVDKFDKWMKEEKYMDADEALALHFATKVVDPLKAVAYIGPKNSNSVQNQNNFMEAVAQKISATLARFEEQIKNFFSADTDAAKALTLATADGTMLQVETEEEAPAIGNQVSIDGKPSPDGEYVMPDGSKIIVAESKITEITQAPDPGAATQTDTPPTETAAELKKKLDDVTKERDSLKADFEVLNQKVTALGAQITSKFTPPDRKKQFGEKPKDRMSIVAEELKKDGAAKAKR